MAENQVYLIKSGSNSFVEETEAIIGISGGKLGIGTTHPQTFFHVTGDTRIDGKLTVGGEVDINSTTLSVDDNNIELNSKNDANNVDGGGITLRDGTDNRTFYWSGATSAWTSSEHLYLANGKHFSADELRALDVDGLKLVDQTTSGVLIKGGKVGIHKAAPVYDLDVDGSGNFTSLYVGGNAVLTGEGSIFGKWEDGATQGEIFYTGGNVGVGTDNPEYPLHVFGNSVVDGNFIVNGTSGNLNVSNFNVSGDSIVLNYLGDTLASNRGGLSVRVPNENDKSFEYVGGTSDFWLSSESVQIADGKELQTDKVRAIDAGGLSLQDDAGNGIFVQDGGNVGIKNITPSVALDVSGSAKISANVNVSQDIDVGNSLNVGSDVFEITKDGSVGNSSPQNGHVITWSSDGKWKALPGGGGGSSSSEVPLAFSTILDTGSIHQITFDGGPYDNIPSIATDLEILGDGPLIPYYISGLSNAGYSAVFAQDITVENSYKLHTTFGGRDVLWATGVDAGSIYYNDGDVNVQNNFTIGGNLTVAGSTTTINTEEVLIKDHNLVIASNTGYHQITGEWPTPGNGYAGLYWGTGDNQPSPISLTYQHNKGFAFEGGNVGIGTTDPNFKTSIMHGADGSDEVVLALTADDLGMSAGQEVALGFGQADYVFSKISSYYEGGDGFGLKFYTGTKATAGLAKDRTKDYPSLTIDAGGNIGIGTTNPVLQLQIKNQNTTSNKTQIGLSSLDGTQNAAITHIDEEGAERLSLSCGGFNLEQLTLINNGNVGIGTTNPTAPLTIGGSPYPYMSFDNNQANSVADTSLGAVFFKGKQPDGTLDTGAAIRARGAGAATNNNNDVPAKLVFSTNPGGTSGLKDRMLIDSNGNVGIGTTNPAQKLDVNGNISIRYQNGNSLMLNHNNSGDNYHSQIKFNGLNSTDPENIVDKTYASISSYQGTNAQSGDLRFSVSTEGALSTAMKIDSDGNVGIGTTNPGGSLHVNTVSKTLSGTVSVTADTTAVTGSGTAFNTELSAGDRIKIGSQILTVQNITDNTTLTLSANHTDGANGETAYTDNNGLIVTSAGNVDIGGATKTTSLKINTNSTLWADANADDLIIRGADAGLTISSSTSGSGNIYFGDATSAQKQGKIVYDHSKDSLCLATAGDDAITIAGGGNVGIGTTSPGAKLDVNDNTATDNAWNTLARFRPDLGDQPAEASIHIQSYPSTTVPADRKAGIQSVDDAGSARALVLNKDGGNVGIGTTNPDCNLSVVSDTNPATIGIHGYGDFSDGSVAARLKFLGKDSDGNNRNLAHIQVREHSHPSGTGSMEFFTRKGGNEVARMVISDDGNVGIGTTNPINGKLEVKAAASGSNQTESVDIGITQDANTTASKVQLRSGVTGGTNPYFAILTRNNNGIDEEPGVVKERMRITHEGNVGIGTTSPDARLTIKSSGASTNPIHVWSSDNQVMLQVNEGSDTSGRLFLMDSGQNSVVKIATAENSFFNGGNVGIGTANPGYELEVVGDINATVNLRAAGTIITSDDRLKHNEQAIVGAIETLGKITPKKYIKTADMYEANHNFELDADGNPVDENGEPVEHNIEAGVIAQQVLGVPELAFVVNPEGVDEDGNVTSPHGLNYNSLFTYAIAAIQEQQQIIEDLKSQNASLESRISALES